MLKLNIFYEELNYETIREERSYEVSVYFKNIYSREHVILIMHSCKQGSSHEPGSHGCWSLSRFLKHEATRNIANPPGWNASPSQVGSPQLFVKFPWVELRHCVSKVSRPRTQHNDPTKARTRTSRSRGRRPNH